MLSEIPRAGTCCDRGEARTCAQQCGHGGVLRRRIDDFVIFESLDRRQIGTIVKLQAQRVADRLKSRKIKLELTDGAVDFLADKARPRPRPHLPLHRPYSSGNVHPRAGLLKGVTLNPTHHRSWLRRSAVACVGREGRQLGPSQDASWQCMPGLP